MTVSAGGFWVAAVVMVGAALATVSLPGAVAGTVALLVLLLGLAGLDVAAGQDLLALLQLAAAALPVVVLLSLGLRGTRAPLLLQPSGWVRWWPVAVVTGCAVIVLSVWGTLAGPHWSSGGSGDQGLVTVLRHRSAPAVAALLVLAAAAALGAVMVGHVDALESHHQRSLADRRARDDRERRRRADRERARAARAAAAEPKP